MLEGMGIETGVDLDELIRVSEWLAGVMGRDLPAVDATCCRIMGIDPGEIEYLQMAEGNLGNTLATNIEQRGERIQSVHTPFQLIDRFKYLRLNSVS